MKPKLTVAAAAMVLLICCFFACTKDHVKEHYTFFSPVYLTKDAVKNNIRSNAPRDIEQMGKLAVKDNYIFLNEPGKGVHIIDNSNPASPRNIAFVAIPGNVELALRDHYLYADCYTSLAVIDVADPTNVVLKQFVNAVFPEPYYPSYFLYDSSKVIVDWQRHDTVTTKRFSESFNNEKQSPILYYNDYLAAQSSLSPGTAGNSLNGTNGSMAKFGLLDNRLYAINGNSLKVFNTTNAGSPVYTNSVQLAQAMAIETIFPFAKQLFIGTQTGMLIYSVANADQPAYLGKFGHVTVCDPVIADNKYAYVTMHSGDFCGIQANELDVLDISNLMQPALVKAYSLNNPKGLSKDGDLLLICDGNEGLKLFDASSPANIVLLKQVAIKGTYDVIARNKQALVIAADGLYFVDYSQPQQASINFKIPFAKK